MIFDRGADYATRVGNEIRNDQHSALVQGGLGLCPYRDIGAFDYQPRLHAKNIGVFNSIGAGGRDQDVAIGRDYRFARTSRGAGKGRDALAGLFRAIRSSSGNSSGFSTVPPVSDTATSRTPRSIKWRAACFPTAPNP